MNFDMSRERLMCISSDFAEAELISHLADMARSCKKRQQHLAAGLILSDMALRLQEGHIEQMCAWIDAHNYVMASSLLALPGQQGFWLYLN